MNDDHIDEPKTPDDGQTERPGAAPKPFEWGDGAWGEFPWGEEATPPDRSTQ